MTSVLTREEKRTQTQRKRPREDGDRDGSEAATRQRPPGQPVATRKQAQKAQSAFPFTAGQHLDFRLLPPEL